MAPLIPPPEPDSRRQKLWRIIFLSDTPAGRAFDVALLWFIAISVFTVVMESVEDIRASYGPLLIFLEWTFTIIFTAEYIIRLWIVRRKLRYARSFFGLVDLLSILPSWLELVIPDAHYLMALRVLRLMRMFRILKMAEHLEEASVLVMALRASRRKILVFMLFIISLVCVEGTIMYVIEHDANSGFTSIPQAIYWAIVTITTVGYGDISPATVVGKMMASVIMLTGFAIIAVPTGIVSSELNRESRTYVCDERSCTECGCKAHAPTAIYCHHCSQALPLP